MRERAILPGKFINHCYIYVTESKCYRFFGTKTKFLLDYFREREFKVTIKFVAVASMVKLQELLSGKQVDNPQEAINVIDIVLRELAAQRCFLFLFNLEDL